MSFRELYDYCQTLTVPVGRNALRDRILAMAGMRVRVIKDGGLDIRVCRGYYLSASNAEHPVIVQAGGANVIVLARDNNRCWERFVFLKELLHVFDSVERSMGTGPQLEAVLQAFEGTGNPANPQSQSEYRAMWMAAALMCPEARREEYVAISNLPKDDPRYMDDLAIATSLRMPRQWVQRILQPSYSEIIQIVLAAD